MQSEKIYSQTIKIWMSHSIFLMKNSPLSKDCWYIVRPKYFWSINSSVCFRISYALLSNIKQIVSSIYFSPISMNRSITFVALSTSIKLLKRVINADAIKGSSIIFRFLRTLLILGAYFYIIFFISFDMSKSFGVSFV